MKAKPNIELASDKPDIATLIAEISTMTTNASHYYSRAGIYYDIRYCQWPGQSDDGRKHAENMDKDPFPWESASDARVRLADKIIRERTALRKLAFWSKRIKAVPIGSQNMTWAATVNPLLQWLLYTHCLSMMRRELELICSWTDGYGACVLGVFWDMETRLAVQTINMDGIRAMANQSGDPNVAQLAAAIADPLQDPVTVPIINQMLPDMKPAEIGRMLKKLRATGEAEIKTPYVFRNQPKWVALRPFVDVFFDPAADDLQRQRLIAYREFLTETELRDRVATEGWNEAFVEEALKHKGKSSLQTIDFALGQANRLRRENVFAEDTRQLIEIWHGYAKTHDNGATAVWRTVFHKEVNDLYARHDRLDYEHEQLPFVEFQQECMERPIMESRGIPEICMTWQNEMKTTRDFHKDRESLDILPTLQVPRGQAGSVILGPAQQVERKRAGDYEFLTANNGSPSSGFSFAEVKHEVNEYFGRNGEGVDPGMVQALQQVMVTDFLTELTAAISQTFKLAQQYLTDEEVQRVVGAMGQQFHVGRDAIQGGFNLEFTFDVRTLNPEFVTELAGMFKNMIVPLDRAGVLDMTEMINILLGGIDPNIAQRVLKSPQAATVAEVDDEQNIIARMVLGIEPPMKPVGNPQLRLQTLQQTMAGWQKTNPQLAQMIQSNPVVGALFANRMKMLSFDLQQLANADIGRNGVAPVIGGDPAAPAQLGMMGGAQ